MGVPLAGEVSDGLVSGVGRQHALFGEFLIMPIRQRNGELTGGGSLVVSD